ncbi:DUF2085 domain-containing protein [Halomicroarcula sp. GCM10025709]|uniref:DUF2085 domain-containing protein n=1 Tax=Haloarcula TaxID=2237 RepID=UPI0024C3F810|nr:DUF2085 domain-containing protein [Halomicroarcula sp. YJ-61-S]
MAAGSRRLAELRRGLAATAPYLLSHHRTDERHRCHRIRVSGREVAVCARCAGVYPGIVAGVVLFVLGAWSGLWAPLVVFGPAPALADWAVTTVTDRRGHNAVRTATGALLGVAYGVALPWVLTTATIWPVAVAVGYGTAAAVGLALSQ